MNAPGPAPPPAAHGSQLAAAVASAVDTVTDARRTGGSGVEVATQYAGGRALGIRLGDDDVEVHIVAERPPLEPLVEEVRSAALQALVAQGDPRRVAVRVEDLDVEALPRGIR